MHAAVPDIEQLIDEHRALMRSYGEAQLRCSELARSQAAEIDRLRAEAMRLRAAVIVRDTALAIAREQRAAIEATVPGLPKRVVLAQRIDVLLARIQDLIRERLHGKWGRSTGGGTTVDALPAPSSSHFFDDPDADETVENLAGLEESLAAADLVICRTGCLSHGAYWRVQDHCKRTGKACVVVEKPDAIRIVRIDRLPDAVTSDGA